MKKIVSLLTSVAICAISLCSCSGDEDNDTIYEQSFPNFFAVVDDLSSSATAVYTNLGYYVSLNYTNMTANVQISGLKLPDGTTYPTMTLNNIPWTVKSDGWKVIKGTALAPSITGFAETPLFNTFELNIFDRVIEQGGIQTYNPGVCVRFTIDARYRVVSTYTPQLLFGETESTSVSGKVFETNDVSYYVDYNTDTRLLNITMNNARFESGMPMALNIELKNIPVSISGTEFTFNVPSITPSIGGVPYDAFPITNLIGSFDPADGLEFDFHCNPRTTNEAYDVEVDCSYGSVYTNKQ